MLSRVTSQQFVDSQEIAQLAVTQQQDDSRADAIRKVAEDWVESNTGSVGLSIRTANGDVIYEKNQNESFFAASLYKLYVAYEGYKEVDAGERSLDDVLRGSQSLGECLDLMIRNSDSPCGEVLWNDIGKQEIDQRIAAYGIVNTDMVNITTTASDGARMLQLIAGGVGLSAESQQAYLDSMLEQPDLYRRGLPSGFSSDVVVYNKVGWNLTKEWHDTAIIELEDGDQLLISVLTENVGIRGVSDLASRIEQIL